MKKLNLKSQNNKDNHIELDKEDDEEIIDTTKTKENLKPKIDQAEIRKEENEQIKMLVEKVIKKAELLTKLCTPASWEASNDNAKLIHVDNVDEGRVKGGNLVEKLKSIRSIQESKGTITSFENLRNKEVLTSCSSSVLACLQCGITADEIMKSIENMYIKAINRYCGFRIIGHLASTYMNDETLTSWFNWFCSSLRNGKNELAHYSDGLDGMGEYLLNRCRTSFFSIYNGIVLQLKRTKNAESIEFLLNCLQWRIGAADHQFILKSGIMQVLKDGNGDQRKGKNLIKDSWNKDIDFNTSSVSKTLTHTVIEALEFILIACFSRLLGRDKDLSIQNSSLSVVKIERAQSLVNTNTTESIMASCFEVIFTHLGLYSQILKTSKQNDDKKVEKVENTDYENVHVFEINEDENNEDKSNSSDRARRLMDDYNDSRTENEGDDEDEEEEEEDENEDDDVTGSDSDYEGGEGEDEGEEDEDDDEISGSDIEISPKEVDRKPKNKKDQKEDEPEKEEIGYDEKVITKLLRLIDVFTSIAIKDSKMHSFVTKVARPEELLCLINLLLNSKSTHGLIILKIFENLIKIKLDKNTIDEAIAHYKQTDSGKKVFSIETKFKSKCLFLQFCYNLLFDIRSKQWNKLHSESDGRYNMSWGIVRLIKSILRSELRPDWKNDIEAAMDEFIQSVDSYPVEEFDVITSLFEGGEYEGLTTGAYGVAKNGDKFTTVGFVDSWYDLTLPDNKKNKNKNNVPKIDQNLMEKGQYLLAIHNDDSHPERNEMFLWMPEEVTVVTSHQKSTHDFLLHEGRLDKLLKALEIDKIYESKDTFSLVKKCVGMKIFVKHLALYGSKVTEVIDQKFRYDLIDYLLKLCLNITPDKNLPKFEWNEQKLYSIKKNAAEKSVGLISDTKIDIKFDSKSITVCSNVLNNEKTISIHSAINYNNIDKSVKYSIASLEEPGEFNENNIIFMDFDESEIIEKLQEAFRHDIIDINVVVIPQAEAQNIFDKLAELEDKSLSTTKSVVILTENGYSNIQDFIDKDTQQKKVIEEDLDKVWTINEKKSNGENDTDGEKDEYCELIVDLGVQQSDEEEKIEFGKEDEKSEDEKSEGEKSEDITPEDQKADDENNEIDQKEDKPAQLNDYQNWFGLDQNLQLIENIIDLSEFTNNYVDEEKDKIEQALENFIIFIIWIIMCFIRVLIVLR